MIIDVSYVNSCVTPWAGMTTQKALLKHLQNFSGSKIELSEVLEFFYKKNGEINASSDTLSMIIRGPYGEEGMHFITAHPRLSSKKMVECLQLVKILKSLNLQQVIRKYSPILAKVVQEDNPKTLMQYIALNPFALFLTILAKTDITPLLEELENYPEDIQLTIWQHNKFFDCSALELAIKTKINLAPILKSLAKLSPKAQALIWQQKNNFNNNFFIIALQCGVDIVPILESIKNLTLNDQFAFWIQRNSKGNNVLRTAFKHAKMRANNLAVLLSALGEFSTIQQLELWRAESINGVTAFELALKSDELSFKKSLTALSNLSIEQQWILCKDFRSILFNAFESPSKCTSILKVIKQFSHKKQFKLWTLAPRSHPLISYGFQHESAVKMFMETAAALKIDIWPQSYDFKLWELYPVFEGMLVENYNFNVFFEIFKQLLPKQQLFFWLGMNREKPNHLINYALKNSRVVELLKNEIANWPLLEQLKLANHLVANNKFYKAIDEFRSYYHAGLLVQSIEKAVNQFINQLDNFDETQNTIINCLNKMGTSSSEKADIYPYLGRKIKIVQEIEILRVNHPVNFSEALRGATQDKTSPLYKALKSQCTLVSSLFVPKTSAVRKLENRSYNTGVKKLPVNHPANVQGKQDNQEIYSL